MGAALPASTTIGMAWEESTANNPQPLKYRLVPLVDVPGLPAELKTKLEIIMRTYHIFMAFKSFASVITSG